MTRSKQQQNFSILGTLGTLNYIFLLIFLGGFCTKRVHSLLILADNSFRDCLRIICSDFSLFVYLKAVVMFCFGKGHFLDSRYCRWIGMTFYLRYFVQQSHRSCFSVTLLGVSQYSIQGDGHKNATIMKTTLILDHKIICLGSNWLINDHWTIKRFVPKR